MYTNFVFQVFVSLPSYILSTEQTIVSSISGYYGTEKIVRGNVTAKLYGTFYHKENAYENANEVDDHSNDVNPNLRRKQEYIFISSQSFWLVSTFLLCKYSVQLKLKGKVLQLVCSQVEQEDLTWDMSLVRDMMGTLQNVELRIEAYVTEYFIDETRLGEQMEIISGIQFFEFAIEMV